MSNREVKATRRDTDTVVTVHYDFGDNLAEAEEKFGEDVVYKQFVASATIDLQSKMRSLMVDATDKDGNITRPAMSQEEIQAEVANWKPGKKEIVRKSPKDKLKDLLAQMSPEDRAALLAQAAEEV